MDTNGLNINVGGAPSAGFSGSADVLRDIARASGGPLPDSYVGFIRQADGGHPEVGSFVVAGGDSDERFDVDWFYSVENAAVERLSDVLASWRAVLGPGALPIARDGGGNQIFLRLNSPTPSVWLYVHDADERERKIADSFEAFLDSLHENPDFI